MRKLLIFTREDVTIDQMISKSSVQNEWQKTVLYAHTQHTQKVVPSCSIDLDSSVQYLHQQLKLGQRETWPGGRFLAQKFTEWRAKHFGGQSATLPENVLVFSYDESEQTEFHIYFHFHWLYETHKTEQENDKQFGLKTWHTKKEPKTPNWKMLRAESK